MHAEQTDTEATPPVVVALDPFIFAPGARSRITGLGGTAPSADPNYVFHTSYVRCDTGRTTFVIEFDGLVGTRGTLAVSINALPLKPGAHARQVKADSITMRELSYEQGYCVLEVSTKADLLYACLGQMYDETDAVATGLRVTMTSGDIRRKVSNELREARRTVFGQAAARSVARLVSTDPATLADPVSQLCTSAQIDEPAYDYWIDVMKAEKGRHRKQWEFVYILQALKRYGMLEPGARGLGFGVGKEPIPAVLASFGCKVMATDLPSGDVRAAGWRQTDEHGATVENLSYPEICSDEVLEAATDFREVDMTAIPDDLNGFDFCWSACALEHIGSIQAGMTFVAESLRCLKPGGIAVHTTEFNLSSNDATVDNAGTVLFRRKDMERLALHLVGAGHEVAQLKYDQGNQPMDDHVDVPPFDGTHHLKIALGEFITTSFGIIVRKAAG